MFETDLILWLQSFDLPWLLSLMGIVSDLGTNAFYMAAFLILAFGVRLKPMLGVLLALVIAGAATGFVKQTYALPRPSEIDARVLDKGDSGEHLVVDGAAAEFWAMPSDETLAAVRAVKLEDFGFISGHASAAVAFALGLVWFFGLQGRSRWFVVLALGWALLIGVSRMYLGRHFPADVLGGWLTGGLAVGLALGFVRAIEHADTRIRRSAWAVAAFTTTALLGLSLILPTINPGAIGEIAGTLACIGLSAWMGAERQYGLPGRVLQLVIAFVLAYGVDHALSLAWDAGGWPDRHPLSFVFASFGYPLAIIGTVLLMRGLWRMNRKSDGNALTPS